jgi:hypothetical protein
MRWAGLVARIGEKRNVYRLLVGEPEGKRPPERLRLSAEITLRYGPFRDRIECCGLDWFVSG